MEKNKFYQILLLVTKQKENLIYPVSFSLLQTTFDYFIEGNNQDYYEIRYVLEGECYLKYNGRSYLLKKERVASLTVVKNTFIIQVTNTGLVHVYVLTDLQHIHLLKPIYCLAILNLLMKCSQILSLYRCTYYNAHKKFLLYGI